MRNVGAGSASVLVALATSFSVLLLAPMGADAQREGPAVTLRGPVHVTSADVVESVVALEGPTRVDGVVVRDVVAVGGDVTVSGTVGGDVVALAGAVRLSPTAQVGGDLVSGREPVIARGAQVRGAVQSMGERPMGTAGGGAARYVLGWLAMTVSAILLALVLGWLVPRHASASVLSAAREHPGRSLGIGLALAILLPVIAMAAMITVIGIPFGIAILIAAGLFAFVGFVASGWVLGRYFASRWDRGRGWDPLAWAVIGVAVLCVATLIPIVGTLIWIVAAMYGTGAIALAFYESRRERRPAERVTEAPTATRPTEEPPPFGAGPEERPTSA